MNAATITRVAADLRAACSAEPGAHHAASQCTLPGLQVTLSRSAGHWLLTLFSEDAPIRADDADLWTAAVGAPSIAWWRTRQGRHWAGDWIEKKPQKEEPTMQQPDPTPDLEYTPITALLPGLVTRAELDAVRAELEACRRERDAVTAQLAAVPRVAIAACLRCIAFYAPNALETYSPRTVAAWLDGEEGQP